MHTKSSLGNSTSVNKESFTLFFVLKNNYLIFMILIVAISTQNSTKFSVNKLIVNVMYFTLNCLLPKAPETEVHGKNTGLGGNRLASSKLSPASNQVPTGVKAGLVLSALPPPYQPITK